MSNNIEYRLQNIINKLEDIIYNNRHYRDKQPSSNDKLDNKPSKVLNKNKYIKAQIINIPNELINKDGKIIPHWGLN